MRKNYKLPITNFKFLISAIGLLMIASPAFAAEAIKPDTGDTAWILVSAALVMLMTPGLALFYGGMVRRKNVLGTIMHSFMAIPIISLQWILIGYTLSFGPDISGFIGSLEWFGLNGVGLTPSHYAPTIPHLAFMIYQGMFAVITPALISGAFAERMKFSSYVIFILLWTTFIYDPVAHWIWGGGWLAKLGVIDFAGGLVVHVTSGISALAAAMIIGHRKGYLQDSMPPHNLPMTVTGTAILWFGWFGFNAGSALSSGELSTMAFVTTHIGAAAGTVTWVIVEWKHRGKPTMFGAATGSIAGLATITPAAGFVGPMSALVIGIAAGSICYIALNSKTKLGYDDSLDAFGVHGVGGIIGTIGAGLFASASINGINGLYFGNPQQLINQLIGIGAVAVYSFVLCAIILKVVDALVGLRVDEHTEVQGLDIVLHGEEGYFI